MLLLKRQRRLRSNKWSINLFRENNISASDFILPIFLTDGSLIPGYLSPQDLLTKLKS